MSDLILVKHAAPEVVVDQPPCQWSLSESGKRQCHDLAQRLARYSPGAILASQEPKAVQTADAIAALLNISATLAPGLHENDRTALPFLPSQEDYCARIKDFFLRCDRRVIGRESADEAHTRFLTAVRELLRDSGARPTVVVTHGTVTTLLVARANELNSYAFWRDFAFTSFAVVSTPSFRLKEVVHAASS